jgi:beta-galactosidase
LSGEAQGDEQLRVVVLDGGRIISATGGQADEITIAIENAKLWTPSEPHLYGLQVTLLGSDGATVDEVESYAGLREVGRTRDADGHLRFTLNGEVIFHWGTLDQGWWPDGLLTPPSDEAMRYDIEYLKAAGFNMIRKHIKVEPRRYYYHCDRLGMLLWQDHVGGGAKPAWTRLKPNPEDANWNDNDHAQFMREFETMVDSLENHPSIVLWVPFNESWGQHRTMQVGKWLVRRDPSRLVNIASGGNFWPVGHIVDAHKYPHPEFPFEPQRFDRDYVKVMGEFGGHGWPVLGQLYDNTRRNWGYGGLPKTIDEYQDRYRESIDLLVELKSQGIAGGVYTQTTDVEGEINGLLTYDRRVAKIPAAELKQIHQPLISPVHATPTR